MLKNAVKVEAIRLAEQHEARLKLSLLEWEKVWHRDNALILRELLASAEKAEAERNQRIANTMKELAERDAALAEAQRMRDEVAAREAAAAAAMRDAAQKRIETQLDLFKRCAAGPNMTGEDYTEGYREACEHGVNNIASLPLHNTDALADALAKARREGIERVLSYLDQSAEKLRNYGYPGKAEDAREWADAIKAALLEDAR